MSWHAKDGLIHINKHVLGHNHPLTPRPDVVSSSKELSEAVKAEIENYVRASLSNRQISSLLAQVCTLLPRSIAQRMLWHRNNLQFRLNLLCCEVSWLASARSTVSHGCWRFRAMRKLLMQYRGWPTDGSESRAGVDAGAGAHQWRFL
jgi:hypothetical protein